MNFVTAAKKTALRELLRVGIEDRFTVKVHPTTAHAGDAVAQYRAMSQFGPGAIFWISPDHPDDEDLIVESILHEYGHLIWEFARVRARILFYEIRRVYPEEENFAEAFAMYASPQSMESFDWMARIIARYTDMRDR